MRILNILIIAIIILCNIGRVIASDQLVEVKSLQNIVKIKLNKIKKSVKAADIKDEIGVIENYLKDTEKLVKDEEFEKAYYIISLAISYFNVIEAKIEMNSAEIEFQKLRTELSDEDKRE